MNIERLRELFALDEKTGALRWRVSPARNVKAGSIAGGSKGGGYLAVKVDRKKTPVHRIVFAMVNGYLPEQVDHINGVRDDNRPCNLRAATCLQNNQNRRIRKDSSSGIKGVCWNSRIKKWQAGVRANGKWNYLGVFADPVKAGEVVRAFRELHHKEFARHD